MKLKAKIILISIVAIIIFCLISLYIQHFYILPTYREIEHAEAGKDICRAVTSINKLKKKAEDAGVRIAAIVTPPDQINNELSENDFLEIEQILKESGLNFCGIFLPELKCFITENLDLGREKKKIFKIERLKQHNLIYNQKVTECKRETGLTKILSHIFLINKTPLPAVHEVTGTILCGYLLDDGFFKKMAGEIGVPVSLSYIYSKNDLPVSKNKNIRISDKEYAIFYSPVSNEDEYIKSSVLLNDINEIPSFVITTTLSRTIYREAHSMLDYALAVFIILGIILIFITAVIIHFVIIKPVSGLTKSAIKIRKSEDLSMRTEFEKRKDEAGALSLEINNLLEQVQRHIENLRLTREDTIFRISMAIDYGDIKAGRHITRVSKMVKLLAEKMNVGKNQSEIFAVASTMHDIGKIGIPENIIGKSGKYTEEEFESMKAHTEIGAGIFANGETDLVKTAYDIAFYHHERWDGSGYPKGLKGKEIPLSARITAVIDVFDGLLSKKSYKKASTVDDAIEFFIEQKHTMFDPVIVDVFLKNIEKFTAIRKKFAE
ncbi:MAG: HD domain-containing protein [Victivallales bacterium]|nr:HD domain-containing protein [Victivallales bacterium]MCF7888653.1 HD domain-containing protein [Victivallales bacterium]